MDTSYDPTTSPARCVYVLSDVDGYKYKLVVQGEVQDLTVRRIKKYLHKAAGIDPSQQLLSFNGAPLQDEIRAGEAGLFDGAILRLQQAAPGVSPSSMRHQRHGRHRSGEQRHEHNLGPADQAGHTVSHPQAYSCASLMSSSAVVPAHAQSLAYSTAVNQAGNADEAQNASCGWREPSLPVSRPSQTSAPPQKSYIAKENAFDKRDGHIREAAHSYAAELELGNEMGRSVDRDVHTHGREMDARVAALSIENVRLREQLQVVARQAADANTDWRLEEEVNRLKAALTAAKKGTAEAERAAALRWRAKEEEMVRELDLLREERRRLQEDAAAQEAKVQDLLHSMEGEIRSLKNEGREKEEALQSARLSLAAALQRQQSQEETRSLQRSEVNTQQKKSDALNTTWSTSPATMLPLAEDIDVLADAALSHLSYYLETPVPLQLDRANDTCVVPVSDSLNLLVTLDRETERMYLYVTLLDALPSSPVRRMRLYEFLLQGALLGKDMAGGGVGLSTESDLVLMSVSADLRHNGALALAAASPAFVECATLWEERIDELFRE